MHALILHRVNQYTKFEVPSFTKHKDMTGTKFYKNGSCDSDHAPFKGLSGYDLIPSICVKNLTILASAVPEISLGQQNLKWVT